jgi:hypothetical protein
MGLVIQAGCVLDSQNNRILLCSLNGLLIMGTLTGFPSVSFYLQKNDMLLLLPL